VGWSGVLNRHGYAGGDDHPIERGIRSRASAHGKLAGMADQTSSFTLKPPGRAIQYVVASIAAVHFGEA
jgi:hypothetical protein